MSKRHLFILGLGALLGGCSFMPKHERPVAPVSTTWPKNVTNTNTTAAASGADLDWREFFDDPRLRQLIGLALENNRDLRVAALRVAELRAQYRIQRSNLFPGVSGQAGLVRQKLSGAASTFANGAILNTYSVDVSSSYEVDLFGRIRSLKTAALEKYLATEEARKTVQIALVAEVATEYLTQLRLRESKAVANQTLETVKNSYDLIRQRFDAGAASELELRTAEAQVQQVKVNSAGFLKMLAESENALVMLIGQPLPDDLPAGRPFQEQRLLENLPVGVPSELLQRRPDILAAEHTLAAANANIGAARAAFFPRILLTGSAGTASASLSDLFTAPSLTWSFAPQIVVPIFDVGGTRSRRDVALVNKSSEIANYEKAIQNAFREVADALAARTILDKQLKAQEGLLQASQKRFELTDARYKQGVDSYVDVLLAQQDLYAARQNLLQFQVARLLNAIALYRSLGGGWKS